MGDIPIDMPESKHVKNIVTIGDGAVGKTCLLHAFTEESFLQDYIPTIFEKSEFDITVDGIDHVIKLYDTAGQEDYDQLRKTIYKHADCFLVCYSVDSRDSYQNVKPYWVKELKSVASHVPIVLCATKVDLRKPGSTGCVTTEEGEILSKQINANSFIECSAKEDIRVRETIYEAVRAAVVGVPEQSKQNDANDGFCCGLSWNCCNIS
uniref:CSON002280 protein n=1 Tax=Culicoides sonorensis TaxID=179676 RepID=A0A336MPS6_CULSO